MKNPDSRVQWPPVFQSYEEYKTEMGKAITEHPPFGEWLRHYRNPNHLLSYSSDAMWDLSVDELKERYIRFKTPEARAINGKRAIAEVHITENDEKYKAAEEYFAKQKEAYKFALEKFEETRKHGYLTLAPSQPSPSQQLIYLRRLKRIAVSGIDSSVADEFNYIPVEFRDITVESVAVVDAPADKTAGSDSDL
jgi:hypothetical protein